MYRLDERTGLQHDMTGAGARAAVQPGGAGLVSTAPDYLQFIRMLLGGGGSTASGCYRESVRLMRTDRLTDEQKRHPFLGAPFWVGRGFRLNLSVVTDPRSFVALFGQRPGDIQLAGRVRNLVAGRPGQRSDPDLPDPELSRIWPRPPPVAGNTALARLQSRPAEVRPADLRALGL